MSDSKQGIEEGEGEVMITLKANVYRAAAQDLLPPRQHPYLTHLCSLPGDICIKKRDEEEMDHHYPYALVFVSQDPDKGMVLLEDARSLESLLMDLSGIPDDTRKDILKEFL